MSLKVSKMTIFKYLLSNSSFIRLMITVSDLFGLFYFPSWFVLWRLQEFLQNTISTSITHLPSPSLLCPIQAKCFCLSGSRISPLASSPVSAAAAALDLWHSSLDPREKIIMKFRIIRKEEKSMHTSLYITLYMWYFSPLSFSIPAIWKHETGPAKP